MAKYIFLGGGGFALELYGYMQDDGNEVLGYYALEESPELKNVISWLGDTDKVKDEDLDKEAEYIVAVRLIRYRLKMIDFIEKYGLKAGTFIHSEAYLSKAAKLGKGTIAFPRAMITGNVRAGDYLFIDALSIISHDDILGNNIVIGPAVTICGDVHVGDNCTFGVNSAVLPGTVIERNSEIAIGTYPRRRVFEGSTIISQPGRNFGKGLNKNFKPEGKTNG